MRIVIGGLIQKLRREEKGRRRKIREHKNLKTKI